MSTDSDGRCLYVEARLRYWQRQRLDVARIMERHLDSEEEIPQFLVNEFFRLNELIKQAKGAL